MSADAEPETVARVARENGFDLGEVIPCDAGGAEVAADRGTIALSPLGDEVYVTMYAPTHQWATGHTTKLPAAVAAAAAWQRGITLRDLVSRYPFMHYEPLAQAYEDGDPIDWKWRSLIDDPDLTQLHDVLVAAHASPLLCKRMPEVSHLTLLRMYGGEAIVYIYLRQAKYEVGSSTAAGIEVDTVGEAVAAAACLAA